MLDWLVEVTTAFKCRERTYFLCASLFDHFLHKFPVKLENKDVYGIGVTCLFLGSKYEDVFPLTSDVISDKVAHGVFSQSNIKTREMIML
jgi:cyclin B/cyclin A